MRPAHPTERAVGMAHYVSDADGVGGRLRARPEDFRVRELERFDVEPLDADPGAYPHLVCRATLRGWDTNDFAGALSNALGISRERVSWAGTKDKRAVSTQLLSVEGVDPADLPDLADADCDPVGRAGRPVLFGDLAGNAFEVVVRDADAPENLPWVTAALAAFAREDGEGAAEDEGAGEADGEAPTDGGTTVAVPNYFGQQRFGSRRPVTHEVGLRVVRGDWEGAVFAYVANPFETEPEDTRAARRYVDETVRATPRGERDWATVLERLPERLGFERSMVHRLDERGGEDDEDYRVALEAVPTNLQRLFVNAAQSYVFNLILSERLERGLPFGRPVEGDVVCFADREAPAGLRLPDTDRTQRVSAGRLRTVERHCERDRAFVTAPLVGTETDLGDGVPGEVERAVLDDLDLAPGMFDLPGEFHSTGTRRAIRLATDLSVERDPPTFAFELPKGSYATVLLREYLKVEPRRLG